MPLRVILFVIFVMGALAGLIVWLVRQNKRSEDAARWPVAEGTIQSVKKVAISTGRSSYQVDVGEFTYIVNGEYNSGRLQISRSFSTGDAVPKDLTDEKIQVCYNPAKPEEHSVPQQEIKGFLLDPFDEDAGTDIGPFDLDIGKI